MEINVISEKEKDKLEVEIEMCLQLLYNIENITGYNEPIICDCIDLLQNFKVNCIKDIIRGDK